MKQKIRMSDGYYEYKSIPLYLGIKPIDKEKSFDNLLLLKSILCEHDIIFLLAFGTLLGVVRDKDFISHDEDIDLIIWDEYKQKFFDLLPVMRDHGFEVARYDRRSLISIIRNGEYIDIYFFKANDEGFNTSGAIFFPSNLIRETVDYEFKNTLFKVPKKYECFLDYEYGQDWRTPIQWNDFGMPQWKRKLYTFKDRIKDYLPDSIYFLLAKYSEESIYKRYVNLYNNYIRSHNI